QGLTRNTAEGSGIYGITRGAIGVDAAPQVLHVCTPAEIRADCLAVRESDGNILRGKITGDLAVDIPALLRSAEPKGTSGEGPIIGRLPIGHNVKAGALEPIGVCEAEFLPIQSGKTSRVVVNRIHAA